MTTDDETLDIIKKKKLASKRYKLKEFDTLTYKYAWITRLKKRAPLLGKGIRSIKTERGVNSIDLIYTEGFGTQKAGRFRHVHRTPADWRGTREGSCVGFGPKFEWEYAETFPNLDLTLIRYTYLLLNWFMLIVTILIHLKTALRRKFGLPFHY